MRHVIVGCGRLGATLATTLVEEGHEVAIVDRDANAFLRLGPTFRGHRMTGAAFDKSILEAAGVAQADGFATMTNADNTNFVLAATARWRYRVPRVVARIYDPVKADIYRKLGIPTVSPTSWGAARVRDLLSYHEVRAQLEFGDGDVELVELEVSPLLQGHTVSDLTVPEAVTVVSLVRAGRAFIPRPETVLQAHDMLHAAVRTSSRARFEALVGLR